MEVFKNTFDGGLDTNTSYHLINPNRYVDAANVNIASDGSFFALENIKGTTDVTNILGPGSYNVLGVYSNKYKIDTVEKVPCLTIIVTTDTTLSIICYDLDNEVKYVLYEAAVEDYNTEDRVLDGFLYPEAGLDILYFTDNFFKIRKLRCEIPNGYTANFLDPLDLQMQRHGGLGLVELDEIVEGGSLFCGSYQIAYQLLHPETNQYTKFSLFCNPIHIFLKPTDPFGKAIKSGIGLQSNYKIRMNINISEVEAAYYTHFRLAVLENIEPSGVNVEIAQLTSVESIADFINGTVLEDVEYNANVRLESINISEIVVDHMALAHVKTLAVRQNRLIAGNVTYKELEYDNGEPAITGGSVIKRSSSVTKNSFADPEFASLYRGHFRGEVYRYAISYFDEDLNFSFPRVLNMSTVTYNQLGIAPPDVVSPNPELIQAPSFDDVNYWTNLDYPGDDPQANPTWSIGSDAIATLPPGPFSTAYLRQAITLDSTKTYNYVFNLSTTVTGSSWNVYMSFWNNTTLLDEFGISGASLSVSGSVQPPASTTHIGLRAFTLINPGDFTFLDISLKEPADISGPIPAPTITGYDLKYPGRSLVIGGESFTLFDDSGAIQSLGLELDGIDNHPTWARGFVILRAKRIKDVLFQTPIIPMKKVYGVGALEEYPTLANELSGAGRRTLEYPSAQPMGPFTTYVPRNYHWKNPQDIEMFAVTGGAEGGGLNKKFTGEAYIVNNPSYVLGMIFPPEYMYETKPFIPSPNYKVVTVDAMLARKDWSDYGGLTIGSQTHGRNIKTSVSATFHALEDARYYYDEAHGGVKDVLSDDNLMSDYREFSNLGEGGSIAGYNVFRYDKLETEGIFWGTRPLVHKCAVIKLDSSKTEINDDSGLDFAIGSQTARGGAISLAFDLDQNNVQTFEIVNISAGLEDTRYGKVETPHEFIFTGTLVTFTDSELVDVQAGNSVPKDVEVWGGDCYVTPHLFKINDSSYGLSNSEKFEAMTGLDLINGVRNWEKCFNDLEVSSECSISIPVPYKNAAQYLQVVMESEYNAGVIDNEIINTVTTVNDDFPLYAVNGSSEGSAKVPLTYELNTNHRKQNSDKIFRIKDPLNESHNNFEARLIYSDQKVYQTNINGFDIFRVLNFYDLEETYGPINSLATAGDELYSLQDRGVAYIGIGERLLETTEALQLSVQSGSYIGNVMYLDTDRGTQHLKSVLKTGTSVYFVDNRNRTVNRISGKSLDIISESTMASKFRQLLSDSIRERYIHSHYDTTHKQLWFTSNRPEEPFCYVFDEARNMWVSNYEFTSLKGLAHSAQTVYVVGEDEAGLNLYSMYTGNRGQLMNIDVTPSVTSVVNPNAELGKVYDALLLPAHEQFKAYDITIHRTDVLNDQILVDQSINTNTRAEGNYRAKILRGENNERLRGLYGLVKLKWHDNSNPTLANKVTTLPSFLVKYRVSENKF